MTQRYKLTIEYDGGPFVGWQRQDNGPSVQESLERAVHGFRGETVIVQGAGRTDAGVHALGQVAHIDLEKPAPADKVRDAVNAHLRPDPIAVLSVDAVSSEFHARFDAIQRHYLYRMATRRAPLTLTAGQAWAVHRTLEVDAMHAAAQCFVGHHDFTTFRAVQCQAESPLRTLDRITVSQVGEEIHVTVSARSFLHNQVRSMVGSLKRVGEGKWSARDLKKALEAKDRTACGPVAPAHGLYLERVDYPAP